MLQTPRQSPPLFLSSTPNACEYRFYDNLRYAVPIIDAAIQKIVRLTGGCRLICENEAANRMLDEFSEDVPVGLTGFSLQNFIDRYLDSLLTYGNAIGEVLVDSDTGLVKGLYNGDPSVIEVRMGQTPLERQYVVREGDAERLLPNPQRILFSALAPKMGHVHGQSILRGLPALSEILMRIYECIGQNFDRVGNVRYAVTYKPTGDSTERAYAKERAMQIAKEWSDGMNASRHGEVRDFVAVGDVDIKVIGAENQLIDTNIPVRQLLEQLISKLSIPPFLLGLSWSSTERMSSQQADILTSELEYYRRLLNPVLQQIGQQVLSAYGIFERVSVEWPHISLQDEAELAQARLHNAQAIEIELRNAENER